MAKKTLLSENQIASFMKLANIRADKIQNFKKVLKEEASGMYGTGGMEMEEDEPEADMEMDMEAGTEMEPVADMEPEAPEETVETGSEELMTMIKDAVKAALADAGLGQEAGGEEEMEVSDEMEDMDMESDEMLSGEEEMEEEGEEEEELQEAKKMKAVKKARNLKGGDAKKMKESLAFDNVDLVTDDEIINEVLKRVIRRLV